MCCVTAVKRSEVYLPAPLFVSTPASDDVPPVEDPIVLPSLADMVQLESFLSSIKELEKGVHM